MENNYYGWGLPIDISTHGYAIDQLIYIVHGLMAILFIGWIIYLVVAIVKFRQRPGHKAEHKPHHHFVMPTYAEIAIAVAEVVLLCAFSLPIFSQVRNDLPDKDKALHIRVIAEQFAWNIHYPGKDGVFGRTAAELMSSTNPVGIDNEDLAAKDDIIMLNQLNIPVNMPIIVDLMSKDVIHSFAIPVMRVKQDMIPGQSIPVWFEATQTGNFEIACAQLCGLGHYRMKGFFNVKSKDEFREWYDSETQKKLGKEEGVEAA